jgi:hypothetical protein
MKSIPALGAPRGVGWRTGTAASAGLGCRGEGGELSRLWSVSMGPDQRISYPRISPLSFGLQWVSKAMLHHVASVEAYRQVP